MTIHRLTYLILAAFIIFSAASCKKDKEGVMTPSLDGSVSFTAPEFISPGQTLSLTPKGGIHPEGDIVGYYWKVNPGMTRNDTTRYENGLDSRYSTGNPSDGTFTYTFPDSLGTFTIYCYAFASGYTSLSDIGYTTTVKGGKDGSVTGVATSNEFITYEGIDYEFTTVGNQVWTIDNLAVSGSGVPFRNAEVMSDVFGRFYNYEEAVQACQALNTDPSSSYEWVLPSEEDWVELGTALGVQTDPAGHETIPGIASKVFADAYFNDIKMWEYWPAVGEITNETKLSFIPAGYANLGAKENGRYTGSTFTGLYDYATFWTSTSVENEDNKAYCRYLFCKEADLFVGERDKESFGASVRCIRKNK